MSPGPAIVDKDTDLNELIPSLVKGGFDHTGQSVCLFSPTLIESLKNAKSRRN